MYHVLVPPTVRLPRAARGGGMVAKGGRRRDKDKSDTRQSDSSDEDDSDEEHDEEGSPPKFVLAGDDTGSGIDYNVLDEDSWQKLEDYCKV